VCVSYEWILKVVGTLCSHFDVRIPETLVLASLSDYKCLLVNLWSCRFETLRLEWSLLLLSFGQTRQPNCSLRASVRLQCCLLTSIISVFFSFCVFLIQYRCHSPSRLRRTTFWRLFFSCLRYMTYNWSTSEIWSGSYSQSFVFFWMFKMFRVEWLGTRSNRKYQFLSSGISLCLLAGNRRCTPPFHHHDLDKTRQIRFWSKSVP
jgi:hypothetical protein